MTVAPQYFPNISKALSLISSIATNKPKSWKLKTKKLLKKLQGEKKDSWKKYKGKNFESKPGK